MPRITVIFAGLLLTVLYSKLAFSQETVLPSENIVTNADLNKGAEYFKNGQYQEAIGQFQRAIQLNPEDALAYSLLGSTYLLLGQEEEGEKNIRKGIELYKKAGDDQKAEKLISLLSNYDSSKKQTIDQEAAVNLKMMQLKEKILRLDKKDYIACDSTEDCNRKLNLKFYPGSWEYRVFIDAQGSFCSEAKGSSGTSNWFIKQDGDPIKGTCRQD